MTIDQIRDKYSFAKNMTPKDLKKLLIFIMNIMLDISMHEEGEKTKVEIFIDDVKALRDE